MEKQEMVRRTAEYVKGLMTYEPGHDWFHVERVVNLAKRIGVAEGADIFIVEMAALLHDIDDWKFSDRGSSRTIGWMKSAGLDAGDIEKIVYIIENISFKGASHNDGMKTIEGRVVQDADRLDALGAIGISRCFSFAGHVNNPIHDPSKKARMDMTEEEYRKNKSTAINHLYEKVLLLKDRMNTKTGREIAADRHKFVDIYLDQFFKEWEGKV